MADSDVIGILSLVLAAAGAAYLVWTRVLRASPRPGVPDARATAGDDRAAETMPPALRPPSEISPTMRARQEARGTSASARPPPSSSTSESPPSTSEPSSSTSESSTPEPLPSSLTPSSTPSPSSLTPSSTPSPSSVSSSSTSESATPSRDVTATKAQGPAPAETLAAGRAVAAPTAEARDPDVLAAYPPVDASKSARAAPAVKPARVADPGAAPPIVEASVLDEGADVDPPEDASAALAVHALGRTDPGKRRKDNEDSLLVLEGKNVFVVADGMGEHGGQRASGLAVETIAEAFEHACFDAAPHDGVPLAASELARAIQMANVAILREANERPELKGMGSTLTAARLTAGARRLYVGHVGDGRCYRLRDGVMKQLTTDHTMSDYGVAGPEGTHLSRVLGAWPTVAVDVIVAEPRAGDVYLLCTDGLTKMIPDGTIATQLLHEEDPKAALERLVFFANAHGGKDNITAILLRVVAAAPPG